MIGYMLSHPSKIWMPFLEHIELTLITLVISVVIAGLLTALAEFRPRTGDALRRIFSVVYSVPSLALFALLIPVTGLGRTSAIIVLTLYNQYLLLRNFLAGLDGVDPAVMEAAKAMGMTPLQRLE